MPALPFDGVMPTLDPTSWIAPGAQVIGNVTLGPEASVWYNCVLRGDVESIVVGARTNIQDGTVVHVTTRLSKTVIGEDCLIGHLAMVHGCLLENRAFVGLGSIVMDGCVIEEGGMLAAGAMLTPGKRIGRGQMWAGRPAKYVRDLTAEQRAYNDAGAAHYVELARRHRESLGGSGVG